MEASAGLAVPEALAEDLRRATAILKEAGCTEVYLFGSVAKGQTREGSDIDFAVRGCPSRGYFRLLGKLSQALGRDVDVIDLEMPSVLTRYLTQQEGRMIRIG